MARHSRAVEGLPTIRRVPDEPWARVAPSLESAAPPRLRIDPRAALDASVYRLRSGVQWTRLPEEVPDDRSVHRTLRRRVRPGVLDRGWGVLVADGTEDRAQPTHTYSSTSLRRWPDRCSFLA
jgi:transposase